MSKLNKDGLEVGQPVDPKDHARLIAEHRKSQKEGDKNASKNKPTAKKPGRKKTDSAKGVLPPAAEKES